MVENRFYRGVLSNNENIFEATRRKKYFEESNRTVSDIHPHTFYLGRGGQIGTDNP